MPQVLLPPIIFYAGFSLKKKLFFQNFATIFTLGFWGTVCQAASITFFSSVGLQMMGLAKGRRTATALALGAICSCSDTVGILQVRLDTEEAVHLDSSVILVYSLP